MGLFDSGNPVYSYLLKKRDFLVYSLSLNLNFETLKKLNL